MPLTCYCDEDYEPGDVLAESPHRYVEFSGSRRKRCASCKELIGVGDLCADFRRFKIPETDIEERIYDDRVPLATGYLCETCADLFFSLEDLGFCVSPTENQLELVAEYAAMQEYDHANTL